MRDHRHVGGDAALERAFRARLRLLSKNAAAGGERHKCHGAGEAKHGGSPVSAPAAGGGGREGRGTTKL
jgi:hypothetical protein